MKKIVMILISISIMIMLGVVSYALTYPESTPNNPYNRAYYVKYYTITAGGSYRYFWVWLSDNDVYRQGFNFIENPYMHNVDELRTRTHDIYIDVYYSDNGVIWTPDSYKTNYNVPFYNGILAGFIEYSNFDIQNQDGTVWKHDSGKSITLNIVDHAQLNSYPEIEITAKNITNIWVQLWKEDNPTFPTASSGKWYVLSDYEVDTVTNKVILPVSTVPWTEGHYVLAVEDLSSNSSLDVNEILAGTETQNGITNKFITFDVTNTGEQSNAKILGIVDNEELQGYKTFSVRKHKYSNQVGLIINGKLIDLINGKEAVKYYHDTGKLYPVGINKLELKDMETGQIIDTVNFKLLRDDTPDVTPPEWYGSSFDNGILPEFNPLDPSTWFTPIIVALNKITIPIKKVTGIVSQVYSFLPPEYVVLGVFAISCGIFLQLIGRKV